MAKKIWLGHAPDIAQVDAIDFDETSASVLAESSDLSVTINGKTITVDVKSLIKDLDTTAAGDTYGVRDLLQKMEAEINGTDIPEFTEILAEVEELDADEDALYHRLLLTGRTAGKPFTATVTAPNPTVDIDQTQEGAAGQNAWFSFYITPAPTGGQFRINWNLGLGDGLETSGLIDYNGDADAVKAAMIAGMTSFTVDNLDVSGSGTSTDPFLMKLMDDLAETDIVNPPSIDTNSLTGNAEAFITTIVEGGQVTGGGSSFENDNFTDTDSTALSSHVSDSTHTWSKDGTGDITIQSNKASFTSASATDYVRYRLSENTHADFEATVDVNQSVGVNGGSGFLFRRSSSTEYLGAVIDWTSGVGTLLLFYANGGVLNPLAYGTINHTAGTTYTLTLTVSGSSITLASDLDSISASSTFNETQQLHGIIAYGVTSDAATFDNLDFVGVTTTNEQWAIYTNGAGGTFDVDNPDSSNPQTLSAGATTAEVKSALETLYASSTFTVTGTGVSSDPWIATDNTGTDLTEATVDGAALTGNYSSTVVEEQDGHADLDNIWQVYLSNATGGNWRLEFRGRQTVNIAYNATNATVETDLDGLTPGSWSGVFSVTGSGTLADPFVITSSGIASGQLETMYALNEGGDAGDEFALTGTALGVQHSTIVSPTGRHWWDNDANWRDYTTGLTGVPATGDEAWIMVGDAENSIWYGLDQSAVSLDRLIISSMFTGQIGLPQLVETEAGTYYEYRDRYLQIAFQGSKELLIGTDQGQGSGLIRINTLTDPVDIRVERTDGPAETGAPSFCWIGDDVLNTIELIEGVMGIAVFPFETATYDTLKQRAGLLQVGEGGDCQTEIDKTGGSLYHQGTVNGQRLILREA